MPIKDKEKNREYQRKWYAKNKQTQFNKIYDRKKKISQKLRDYKKTVRCKQCGESHPSCMDFHHKDPSQKKIIISQAVHSGWGWKRIMNEIDKCSVLCSNCHRKFHWNDQG